MLENNKNHEFAGVEDENYEVFNDEQKKRNIFLWVFAALLILGFVTGGIFIFSDSSEEASIGSYFDTETPSTSNNLSSDSFNPNIGPDIPVSSLAVEQIEAGVSEVYMDEFLPMVFITILSQEESDPQFTADQHNINLVTPSGQRITPSLADSKPEGKYTFEFHDQSHAIYYVSDPEPGTWRVKHNPDLNVRIMPQYAEGGIEILATPETVSINETVAVSMYLNELADCSNKDLSFYATKEAGKSAILDLSLAQNGSAYEGDVTFEEPGMYTLSAQLICQHDGGTVNRHVITRVTVNGETEEGFRPDVAEALDQMNVTDPISRQWYGTFLLSQDLERSDFRNFSLFDTRKYIQNRKYREQALLDTIMSLRLAEQKMLSDSVLSDDFTDDELPGLLDANTSHEEIIERSSTYLERIISLQRELFEQKNNFYDLAIRNHADIQVVGDNPTARNIIFEDQSLEAERQELLNTILILYEEIDDLHDQFDHEREYISTRIMARISAEASI